jgi:hypothetical protein
VRHGGQLWLGIGCPTSAACVQSFLLISPGTAALLLFSPLPLLCVLCLCCAFVPLSLGHPHADRPPTNHIAIAIEASHFSSPIAASGLHSEEREAPCVLSKSSRKRTT